MDTGDDSNKRQPVWTWLKRTAEALTIIVCCGQVAEMAHACIRVLRG
ncbi:hypothetical protein [Kitasatospora purpeofusca]|nr:hypothetical protein [Kitasatospora purpeofusca]MDY0811455.1 hypothetical protein [Kitasatospora purpeofusca]